MKHKNLFFILLGGLLFVSCQHLDDSFDLDKVTAEPVVTDYYLLMEEALNEIFNETYENVTINTSIWEMSDMIDKNTKNFFTKKGFKIDDVSLQKTRNVNSNKSSSFYKCLSEEQEVIIKDISKLIQLSDYKTVRSQITEIRKSTVEKMLYPENLETYNYVKHIDNVLNFFEKYREKMNIIGKHNEFHEIECTQTQTRGVGFRDGLYANPFDPIKFLLITNGYAYNFFCAQGTFFNEMCQCCSWDGNSVGGWGEYQHCVISILEFRRQDMASAQDLAEAMYDAITGVFKSTLVGCKYF